MNPLLGRWVSADPLAVHAPGEADLNLFAYVSGSVLKSVDPLGLCACPVRGGEPAKLAWISDFSRTSKSFGLSGSVVRDVLQDKRISVSMGGSENYYSVGAKSSVSRFFGGGTIHLKDATVDAASNARPGAPSKMDPGLAAVYHEVTHAYMDLHSERLAGFVERGAKHYEGASVKTASGERFVNQDSERLFHEALGEYAGARVEGFTEMRDQLVKIHAGGNLTDAVVDKLRTEYNQRMGDTTKGYEESSGDKAWTDRAMTKEMTDFVDNEILDGEISGDFDTDFADVLPANGADSDSAE